MNREDAIEIVLELAKENIISEEDADLNDLIEHRNQCIEAVNTIEDFFVTIVFDDGCWRIIELSSK